MLGTYYVFVNVPENSVMGNNWSIIKTSKEKFSEIRNFYH